MKGKTYKLSGKVWKWDGAGPWHFVYIDKQASEKIKKSRAGIRRKGFGSIRVVARIKKSEWRTSIFPTKDGPYLLAIKAEIRKREGVYDGDMIRFSITLAE